MMFKLRAGLGAEAVISTSMTAIVMVAASTIKRETASRIKHTSKLLLNGVCRFPDVSGMSMHVDPSQIAVRAVQDRELVYDMIGRRKWSRPVTTCRIVYAFNITSPWNTTFHT
jgi:hypothetical protein